MDDLRDRLVGVTSPSDARAIVRRAARLAGVSARQPLAVRELLLVCEALGAEGGLVQRVAEDVAVRALRQ